MIEYNTKVLGPWVKSHPVLFKYWELFLAQTKKEGINDYGCTAVKRVFYQVICKDISLYSEYERKLKEHNYVPNAQLVELLQQQIKEYGWYYFMIAFRTVVRGYIAKISKDTINRRRLDKTLDLLNQVPKMVVVEN